MKNITAQKLLKGILSRIAGKTIKVKSGPLSGISLMGMLVISDIYPI